MVAAGLSRLFFLFLFLFFCIYISFTCPTVFYQTDWKIRQREKKELQKGRYMKERKKERIVLVAAICVVGFGVELHNHSRKQEGEIKKKRHNRQNATKKKRLRGRRAIDARGL